jgi:TonB family protein
VDFTPYLRRVVAYVHGRWLLSMPNEVDRPKLKKGIVGVRFTILPDGSIGSMTLDPKSGTASFDKAAWNAIKGQGKFPPLPAEFHGPNLELRFGFFYNMRPEEDPAVPTKNTESKPSTFDDQASLVPKHIGNGVSAPVLIHSVEPHYDEAAFETAKNAGWHFGTPVVHLVVDEQGVPANVELVHGYVLPKSKDDSKPTISQGVLDILNRNAVDAVKQYRFKPAMENGKPVAVELNVGVNVDVF